MKKLVLLSLVFLFFLGTNIVYAGITVSPGRKEVHIVQEAVYNGVYTVENGNDETITLSVTCEQWHNSPENANIQIEDWLSVAKKKLILKPRQKAEVPFQVKSKNYTGSLSAMVSFTYSSSKMRGISLMTSVPVYLTIRGTEKVDFEITELSLSNPRMYKEEGIPATFKVKNNGNMPVRLRGILTVKKGKKVISQQHIDEQSPVYAGLDRIFTEKFQHPQKGKYVLNVSLNAFNISAEKSVQFRVNKYGEVSF
ncbi:MAG: hypothetical protein LBU09_02355 [Endomicrobium sp.]|jgi:hypothetical protein|nr:hypothetical protein [Endomicrobium sp.]